MKLMIDIDEDIYNDIQSRDWKNGELIFSEEWKVIHNGIPIPDNATNGDVARAVFGNYVTFCMEQDAIQNGENPTWWNSPYQKGGKE